MNWWKMVNVALPAASVVTVSELVIETALMFGLTLRLTGRPGTGAPLER